MKEKIFRVPEGLDSNGALVKVDDAVDGMIYRCPSPDCLTKLVLRRGRKPLKSGRPKVTHFAHQPGTNCSPDRITHALAQRRIVETVREWKRGVISAPLVTFDCADCWQPQECPLPNAIVDAELEHRISHASKSYKLDVALLPFVAPKFAVEVHKTNYVEFEKEADLTAAGIVYFEVEAIEILQEPARWRVINKPIGYTICGQCQHKADERERLRLEAEEIKKAKEKEALERAELERRQKEEAKDFVTTMRPKSSHDVLESLLGSKRNINRPNKIDLTAQYRDEAFALALKLGVRLPRRYYRYMMVDCWKCHKTILVYTWPGKKSWDPRQPYCRNEPMPSTLKKVRKQKTQHLYWANICIRCSEVQGEGGLDFHINPTEDSAQAFENDLSVIAGFHYNPLDML